jgi:hypothetical protein
VDYPIDAVLDVVRTHVDPSVGWARIVELCRAVAQDAPWDALPMPDVEHDIVEASAWIRRKLGTEEGPCGIYLGLDTLNMDGGAGANAEIGLASGAPEDFAQPDWMFDVTLSYGDSHLIRGLLELHRTYSTRRWRRVFDLCDYTLFLGYSGLVFAQAFERMRDRGRLFPTWGFHDGDLFLLGRYHDGSFVRVCKC